MEFNPFDDRWWLAGSSLNWISAAIAARPAWMPCEGAVERLRGRRARAISAVRLLAGYRTLETRQAHALDPSLPALPKAAFWLDMLGAGFCEPGFPIAVDGRQAASPLSADWMAVRLPPHEDIMPRLAEALDLTPPELATLAPCRGPGSLDWRPNLRGQRQYDRHNLICADLAVARAAEGWRTLGEAWGRFDLICHDPLMGAGGPDLELIGENETVCIELTASMGQSLSAKFNRWARVLRHPGTERVHVVWLAAARTVEGIPERLAALSAERPRQHWAVAEDWRDSPVCPDGFAPKPGTPPEPYDWMRADMDRVGEAVGLPSAGSWKRPRVLMGDSIPF